MCVLVLGHSACEPHVSSYLSRDATDSECQSPRQMFGLVVGCSTVGHSKHQQSCSLYRALCHSLLFPTCYSHHTIYYYALLPYLDLLYFTLHFSIFIIDEDVHGFCCAKSRAEWRANAASCSGNVLRLRCSALGSASCRDSGIRFFATVNKIQFTYEYDLISQHNICHRGCALDVRVRSIIWHNICIVYIIEFITDLILNWIGISASYLNCMY